ncbi:hypothetical protein BHM03_00052967 [Ensete ventricosum]|nr:hypothetical protein BHM03_00052967 [Ensete ventricosum]
MAELWLVDAGLSPASRGTIILLYFSLSNCLLTYRSGCKSYGSRGASRDAQGGKRQCPFDPTYRPRGRCVSCEESPKGFVEEAGCLTALAGRGCGGRRGRGARVRLREELEKTKRERGEELLRYEASEKELQQVWSHLGDAQRLLRETRIRARKMDDELLQAVKDLESARAELPRQSVVQYMESLGFKEGLKRMGWVTYKYMGIGWR